MPKRNTALFKGKNVKYTTAANLAAKLKVTEAIANDIINGTDVKRYIGSDKTWSEYDIRKSPLIFQQLGIKRIPTSKFVNDDATIKKFEIKSELSNDLKWNNDIKGTYVVDVKVVMDFSDVIIERGFVRTFPGTPTQVKTMIIDEINRYVIGFGGGLLVSAVATIQSEHDPVIIDFSNEVLQKSNPVDLFNVYVNIDTNKSKNNTCLDDYLIKKLPKISPKTIKAIGKTSKAVHEFCVKYNINLKVYDICGQIRVSHTSTKKNGSSYASLVYLQYDNHLYPIINHNHLIKSHKPVSKYEIVTNANERCLEFIMKQKILPGDIKMKETKIQAFTIDDTRYIENNEYAKCLKILKSYGIENKINDNISLHQLFGIIEKLYIPDDRNINSFWIDNGTLVKRSFNYKNENINLDNAEVVSIDKNKAYACALKMLPYLLKTDYRTNKINLMPSEIKADNLYIVKPGMSTVLIPEKGVYWGEFLMYCEKEGVQFELLEEMTCDIELNYYTKMIEDLYKNVDAVSFKEICNIGIGKFERVPDIYDTMHFKGIFKSYEAAQFEGFKIDIAHNMTMVYESDRSVINITNKKPIAIQIKDMSRKVLYEKMKQLNITHDNIVQIKTDSISYIGHIPEGLDKDELDKWKVQEGFKPLPSNYQYTDNDSTFIVKTTNNNVMNDCYAGCGKTYKIQNKIIPSIIEKGHTYRVLTPSHSTVKSYRQKDFVCDVIQKYTLRGIFPEEKVIIIDEVGMIDMAAHNFIYKCSKLGKVILCYGDFKQLLPVMQDRQLNSKHYVSAMFNKVNTMTKNWRNKFSKEYYDSLIEGSIDIIKEVEKWCSTDYKNASIIIAFRNSTCDKYNELMMQYLGFNKFSVGLKIMCRTNKLYEKDIYNHFAYTIKEVKGDKIILDDDTEITKAEYEANFKIAYCVTLHCVQGDQFSSLHYAKEDYTYLDSRKVYTLISRLEQKD